MTCMYTEEGEYWRQVVIVHISYVKQKRKQKKLHITIRREGGVLAVLCTREEFYGIRRERG